MPLHIDLVQLGKNLREARTKTRLTLMGTAHRSGLSKNAISCIENGRYGTMGLSTLLQLINAYPSVPFEAIFSGVLYRKEES